MAEEKNEKSVSSKKEHPQMYKKCLKYKDYHVELRTSDGQTYNGILTGADQNQIEMLLPEDVNEGEEDRQYGWNGRRFRRFRRQFFPIGAVVALALFPYYYSYPYYPYPYYPYY
jgi:small nuclear ribonucleoprotein (snRNP)-like protein